MLYREIFAVCSEIHTKHNAGKMQFLLLKTEVPLGQWASEHRAVQGCLYCLATTMWAMTDIRTITGRPCHYRPTRGA